MLRICVVMKKINNVIHDENVSGNTLSKSSNKNSKKSGKKRGGKEVKRTNNIEHVCEKYLCSSYGIMASISSYKGKSV